LSASLSHWTTPLLSNPMRAGLALSNCGATPAVRVFGRAPVDVAGITSSPGPSVRDPVLVRVLMVGDFHCNTGAVMQIIDGGADMGADLIGQLGDFGFWPRTESGRKSLRKAEARLYRHGLQLCWADGNHDDLHLRPAVPTGQMPHVRCRHEMGIPVAMRAPNIRNLSLASARL
jgi:hypothetical protein